VTTNQQGNSAAGFDAPIVHVQTAPVVSTRSDPLMDDATRPALPVIVPSSQSFHTTQQHHNDIHATEDPVNLGSKEDDHLNLHVVGPAVTNDSKVLSDYLSRIPGVRPSTRVVIPVPAGSSRPMLFTMVQKRPVGVMENPSPSAAKLEIIEKILGPRCGDVIDEYVFLLEPIENQAVHNDGRIMS
jgi:hypothetical protein